MNTDLLINQSILAAYTNQARHNLLLVLNNIADKTGSSKTEDDGELKSHSVLNLLTNSDARKQQTVIRGLEQAFPFILPLSVRLQSYNRTQQNNVQKQKNKAQKGTLLPENYYHYLKQLIDSLHQLRNFTSHYKHPAPTVTKELSQLLDDAFDAAIRIIKKRHKSAGFGGQVMEHLRRYMPNPDYKKEILTNKNAKAAILKPDFKYPLTKDNQLTKFGQVFFCCLFLSKQEGYQFLKQISGFKSEKDIAKQATLKVFTCFHIRLPFIRLNTRMTKQILALDMVNELARCPRVLYDLLSLQEQKKYQIVLDSAPDTDEAETDEDNIQPFIRHEERFIPLLMRYFDETQAFSELRFQVDLGDFYFAAYPKTLYKEHPEFQTQELRRLKKKILSFASLTQLEQPETEQVQSLKKSPQWQQLENENSERLKDYPLPYIVPTQPHYHLLEDNICFALMPQTQNVYPDIKHETEPQKLEQGRLYQAP